MNDSFYPTRVEKWNQDIHGKEQITSGHQMIESTICKEKA
jgi:hypothetical protein